MPIFQDLKQFVRSENAHNRYVAIEKLAKNSQSWQGNLLTWQIMALIPTIEEKSKLAKSLSVPDTPSSEWAIVSYLLLKETDENVLSSCVSTVANSKRAAFSHRIAKLFNNPFLTNKILYSLLNYIEETGDETLAVNLQDHFHEGLSEHILAKGFNTLIKLGIVNEDIKNIAFKIIQDTSTPDLEKTSIISAILYLGFSCSQQELQKLKTVIKEIKICEILRVIQVIFNQIAPLEEHGFSEKSVEILIKRALFEEHPSFIGYGAISQKSLEVAIENLIKEFSSKYPEEISRTILKLKNKKCIEILAKNNFIGIQAIETGKQQILAQIWAENIPYNSNIFLNSVQDPKNYEIWHKNFKDLSFIFLTSEVLFNHPKYQWQVLFDKTLDIQLLLSQIVAIGTHGFYNNDPKNYIKYENKVVENIKKCIANLKNGPSINYDSFVEKIYAATIGCNISASFMREVYKVMPFSGTSWVFTAIALSAPRLDIHTISLAIQRELETIRQTLLKGSMEKEEYILEVTSRFQSILVGADRFKVQITQPTLATLRDISYLIQNVLDESETTIKQTDEDYDPENTDWSGNVVADRPILRWGAILQVCLNTNLPSEEKDYYEKFLREGLRVAPHVEKRWIVRALVKLDTDDAIKAILYQALQHIDVDFVEHTIIELLRSKHPRAQQALIRSISKNNITNNLKIRIIKEISLNNPEEILQELKTLQLLRLPEEVDKAIQETVIKVTEIIPPTERKDYTKEAKISSQDIDLIIKSLIPYANELSIDSKSALRTAEMILIQSKEWGNEAVDLSPIVNMHCKAVELTMRDTFEAYTDAIIRKGILSKKLDSIGYGKGVIEKMNSFEEYIANLPVIRSIPYFSKFKLRKMLRAICLYRPGKRFTLDGPKAFALLLLVAARNECQFHLEKILELGFQNDLELFEFIKLVHSLQDSRNRAVHEGLTWEAREEIESMRKQAYKIISTCLTIGRNLEAHANKSDSPMENY